jgi:hypothetical protein
VGGLAGGATRPARNRQSRGAGNHPPQDELEGQAVAGVVQWRAGIAFYSDGGFVAQIFSYIGLSALGLFSIVEPEPPAWAIGGFELLVCRILN